jgi:hypothetical protein
MRFIKKVEQKVNEQKKPVKNKKFLDVKEFPFTAVCCRSEQFYE